jgi:hypothetical protein
VDNVELFERLPTSLFQYSTHAAQEPKPFGLALVAENKILSWSWTFSEMMEAQ